MSKSDAEVEDEFRELVNMKPRELADWLETEEAKSVGQSDGGESTGHASGRQILDIMNKRKSDYTDGDRDHMRKVVGYIKRHSAQRPDGDVADTRWRYSLMNWGHDPLRANE